MKKFTFAILILLFAHTVNAQITFQKTFTGFYWAFSIKQTFDGGYILTGGVNRVLLIKTDINGDTLWTKTFGDPSLSSYLYRGYSVEQTTDSGYIMVGSNEVDSAGSSHVYLIKTNSIGDTLWTKTYGGTTGGEVGNSVQQTMDGGYIIAGSTSTFGAGSPDVYLIKTDANGNLLWSKTFGGTSTDYGRSVQQTTDGGYVIAGYTNSFGAGSWDVYLIKTDPIGDTLWTKTFGGTSNDDSQTIQQTSDGGYIITGATGSFGSTPSDVYLIKANANGNLLWTKTYGGTGNDWSRSVQQTTDGGYIITGETNSFSSSGNVYLIKTDANGDTLWTKTFGGSAQDIGYSVQQTTDGGYIITGYTNSFGAGYSDIYLIKTDSLGNNGCNEGSTNTIVTSPPTQVSNPATIVTSPPTIVTTPASLIGSGGIVTTLCTSVGIKEVNNKEELILFPNPFSDKINITTKRNEPVEITLFDITARKLLHQTFTNAVTLNTEQLAKGIYLYEVRNKDGVIKKGKVIKD